MIKSLFEGLNAGEINGLRDILSLTQQTYPAKTIIPFSDLKSNTIGIINSGLVELISVDQEGREVILSYYIEGSSFGPYSGDLFEMISDDMPSESSYFLVRKNTDITYLNYEELLTDRPKYQETCKKIIQNLIRIRFLDSRARILILSRRSIRERFMTYLEIMWSDSRRSEQRLLQNDPFRENEELSNAKREASVALPFSYTDLAGFLIADRSALMREIKNMKEEGLISEDGQRLRLHWKES